MINNSPGFASVQDNQAHNKIIKLTSSSNTFDKILAIKTNKIGRKRLLTYSFQYQIDNIDIYHQIIHRLILKNKQLR